MDLPKGCFPIVPDDQGVEWKIRITRLQLPIQPVYAVTGHSAQGKTLPSVLVNLHEGGFGAYVAASRARSREEGQIMLVPDAEAEMEMRSAKHVFCIGLYLTAFEVLNVDTLVLEVYNHLPLLVDVLAWRATNSRTRKVGSEVVSARFARIVKPFVRMTAKPHNAFNSSAQWFARFKFRDLFITITEAKIDGLFKVVLCSPTTAGGFGMLYPEWTLNNVAIINRTILRGNRDHDKVGCIRHNRFVQEARIDNHTPHYADRRQVLLYAMLAAAPHLVSVPLRDGVTQLTNLSQLETSHWLDHLKRDKFIVLMGCLWQSFNMLPGAPDTSWEHGYTIIHEDPWTFPPLNALICDIACVTDVHDEVTGNVLVIKHKKGNKHNIVDMTREDVSIVDSLIKRAIHTSDL
ncbi:hypothetical protein F4604DRAFT_1687413 [Suillus subluteus]|nr:hypothetical protein F4604DRAFT_1687413 [Suillus subluteus]